jgi:hypothetical protein
MKIGRTGNLTISTGIFLLLSFAYRFLSADIDRVYIGNKAIDYGCLFKKMTGVPCPGCGGSRSFVMALHGDFYHSIQMNPMGLLVLIVLVLVAVVQLFLFADSFGYGRAIVSRIRGLFEPKILAFAAYFLAAVALGQWIVKLIPR